MAPNTLTEDFKEFLRLLNRHQIRYLVIGGHAVAFHGYPRYTADFDIWIDDAQPNVDAIARVLREFGFSSPGLDEWTRSPKAILRMGRKPNMLEVFSSIPGVTFRDAFEDRLEVDLGGVKALMISLPYLRKNKLATGRHKDLDDLAHLPESHGSK